KSAQRCEGAEVTTHPAKRTQQCRTPTKTNGNGSCYNLKFRKGANSSLMTKVGFVSLGCPKNLVDSEVMLGILAPEGYQLTPRADHADVLVVNTRSFIAAPPNG